MAIKFCSLKIKTCEDCPFFDNEYYSFNHFCGKLHETVPMISGEYKILIDCPLVDFDSDSHEVDN